MFEIASEIIERILNRHQRRGGLVLVFHIFGIFSDNHAHALEDVQIRGTTTVVFQLLLHIAVERLCFFESFMVGEDRIGMLRSQLFTVVRCARLEHNRTSLRRATNIEWPGNLEEITPVIQGMQFGGVKKLTTLFVAHKGIAFPRVPQPFHHIEILIRNAVAQRVLGVFFTREVPGRPFQRRGHDVPARAAVAEMIQAGKLARHGKRFAVGGG